jgi:hypothetical protein
MHSCIEMSLNGTSCAFFCDDHSAVDRHRVAVTRQRRRLGLVEAGLELVP